ncbi:pantoate--beta-alanine ligase [Buchnera aphidicola]|uniref:pantoate--beta-alanine ligase n=1 Tax=Buchnera aphidicola TaxID=9 RepID=UPI003463A943
MNTLKKQNKTIGLIPTMGNLHYGHISLVLSAQKYVDIIIVSIFVNPIQFDNEHDFKKYPQTFEKDCEILKKYNVDIIFFPTIHEMYPFGIKNEILIEISNLSNIIEGQSRPGHFQGVATIICKLFNLVQPQYAFFGEKDYQQLLIIKTIVIELNYMIKIISIPTIRSRNGLALSSRNNHLNSSEIKKAPYLYKIIQNTAEKIIKSKKNNISEIIKISKLKLLEKGFFIDIFNVYDAEKLQFLSKKSKEAIIIASAWLGKTRLIDNKKFFIR